MTEPLLYLQIPGLEHYPHVTYTWLAMIVLLGMTLLVRRSIEMVPEGIQNFVELILVQLVQLMDDYIGKGGRKFMPLIGSLAFYIFVANIMGLFPGAVSPTANINTNAAMALVVFVVYQIVGVQVHGLRYFKQFLGPVWWMSPLMLPVEILSHLARPVTLSMRLFGNIRGEDLVILVLASMFFLLPIPMMFFAIFTSILQTFVFIMLTMVYLSLAVEEHH